jgi:predicted nuclease of predicted toxin-antitoxin system
MRILFDQGTPVPLRDFLPDHTIETAFERGWARLNNGDLLGAAETGGFEVFITTDQKLRYQQNLAGRTISIVVLPTTRWPEIQKHAGDVAAAVAILRAGEFLELKW